MNNTRASLTKWLSILENRHQQEIQLGLERIKKVAAQLELLHCKPTVITVAGTNGKGSTVALLESIYLAAGFSVASYTSPHLMRFNERIKVNGQLIADEQLVRAFELIEKARDNTYLSYFETVTLAALWYFKQHQLDLIILEIGMGGRLDAVNIIDADLAIITTIDFDHQAFLGNTRDAIGFEKAGILRAKQSFIYADNNPPLSVLAVADKLAVISYQRDKEYTYQIDNKTLFFNYQNCSLMLPQTSYHPNSVAAAIMATLVLQSIFPIKETTLVEAISHTVLPGRLYKIAGSPAILIDVSHNPQAANYLADHLKTHYAAVKIHAVFSALADKDIAGLIAPLIPLVANWHLAVLPNKRAANAAQLCDAYLSCCDVTFPPVCHNDPLSAYHTACINAAQDDLIVIYGSFVTAGSVLSGLPNFSFARG